MKYLRRARTMGTARRHIKAIGYLLLTLLSLQLWGCTSFAPLTESDSAGERTPRESRLRVQTRDDHTYIFPSHLYTLKYGADSTISLIKGWGDKYSSLGLIDKGYFEIPKDQIKLVEIEKVTLSQLMLIGGAVVGLSVLAYVGVKVVGGDASGGGKDIGPAPGN
jgi:hypothetical protein